MTFCSGGMLAATRVKMSDKEKKTKQEHVRHFLHKTCNKIIYYLLGAKYDLMRTKKK